MTKSANNNYCSFVSTLTALFIVVLGWLWLNVNTTIQKTADRLQALEIKVAEIKTAIDADRGRYAKKQENPEIY